MIEAFTPDQSDDAFNMTVLPRRPNRSGAITNTHPPDASLEGLAIGPIIVAQKHVGCCIPRKRFHDLACDPLGRRVARHSDMNDLPANMAQDDKREQPLEPD